jgi:DNA-binding CsgD family transcriptional regulator/PAS domain-containing protein
MRAARPERRRAEPDAGRCLTRLNESGLQAIARRLMHTGLTLPQFSDLLNKIYQGPLEPSRWESALEALRTLLDAKHATLILRAPSQNREGLILNTSQGGTRSPDIASYNQHYYALDPFVSLPKDELVTADGHLGHHTWCASDLYRQFLCKLDIRYILGVDIRTRNGVECRLRLCRGHDSRDFSAKEKALCSAVLPHLKRSIDLHSKFDLLGSEQKLYASAIERMQIGMALIDNAGMVIKTNPAADLLLGQRDGISIEGGMLQFAYVNEMHRFNALLERMRLPPPADGPKLATVDTMSITRPSCKEKFGLLMYRIPASEWTDDNTWRPACVAFIRDPESTPETSRDMMRGLFDLTPAETSLALLLVKGATLEQAAGELMITRNTARAHLRAIFSKTGTNRQATLIRTLLTSVVFSG